MVNLIVGVPIWRCPSIFMNVAMWEHCTFDNEFLGVTKFTSLTPLTLLISCKLSFPIAGLKMSSFPTLALKSPNKIFMWYSRNYQIYVPIPHRSCLSHHQFHPLLGHEHFFSLLKSRVTQNFITIKTSWNTND
jgi:hypothetical protein